MHLRPSARHRVPTMLALVATSVAAILVAVPVSAADPIRIGLSISLTGPTSPAGKQVLAGLEIWRDDVNAKGGLLGRQVELVYYDDQSNPTNVPQLYTKLIEVTRSIF